MQAARVCELNTSVHRRAARLSVRQQQETIVFSLLKHFKCSTVNKTFIYLPYSIPMVLKLGHVHYSGTET